MESIDRITVSDLKLASEPGKQPTMSKVQWAGTVIAALLGTTLYVLSFLAPDFIAGSGPYWSDPFGDRITNVVGFLYYLQDGWRFPLFDVPKLGYPEGTNIVFTDSIPLLSLAAKFIYKTTGFWTNYFGWWFLGCYLLLALFSALAARAAKLKDPLAVLAVVLLSVSSPALIARVNHAALMGHFLIVWALFLYLRMRADPTNPSTVIQFLLIAAISVTVQAYFLPMVLIFLIAALAPAVIQRRSSLLFATTSSVAFVGAALIAAWVSGIVGAAGAPAAAWGFGHYSMNLLSPFLPPRSNVPEAWTAQVHWSVNNYTWDATSGQYEGYNYLGAGVIFLLFLVLATPSARSKLWSAIRQHSALVLCLSACVLYAVSNRVFLGDALLLEIPLPRALSAITEHFRTGGRTFWPVYYVLVLALVAITVTHFSRNLGYAIIAAALILQASDTQVLRSNTASFTSTPYPQVLERSVWRRLVQDHDFIEQYPSFQCGGWANTWPENNANMELLLIAAEVAKPINSSYVAREVKNCRFELARGLDFDVRPGGLFFFAGEFPVEAIAIKPRFNQLCREFRFGYVCTHAWPRLDTASENNRFPLSPLFVLPSYTIGEKVRFVTHGNGRQFMGRGWSLPEPWGTWSTSAVSEIFLKLPTVPSEAWTLDAQATAFVHPNRPELEVEVLANGVSVGRWQFRHGDGIAHRSVIVPSHIVKPDGELRMTFAPSSLQSAKEAGFSDDVRPLGFALVEMTLRPISQY